MSNLFLTVHPESQMAGLLKRLVTNPTIQTSEVVASWRQKTRGGGETELSGSKAAWLLDVLGETITGKWVEKETRGEMSLPFVRQALLSDRPEGATDVVDKDLLSSEVARLGKELETARANADQFKAALEAEKRKMVVQADKINIKGGLVEEKKSTKGNEDLVVPTMFPETPVNRPSKGAAFITPDWYEEMVVALNKGRHVSIAGPPGPGKSTAPEEYFIARDQPFVVVNCEGGMNKRDLIGKEGVVNGRSFFQTSEFAAAAINGWGCIINEVNAAEGDALLLINGVIETPKKITVNGKTYNTHKDFRLVVTYNPGLTGTKPLPEAFKDRFFPIKLGFVTREFLKKVLLVNGLPASASYGEKMIDFAMDVWKLQEKGAIRYQISPRRLFDAIFLIEELKKTLRQALETAVLGAIDSKADSSVLRTSVLDKY